MLPGIQVYEPAPLAVRVAQEPAQTALTLLVILTVGLIFTTKFKVCVFVQPNPFTPDKVNIEVEAGVTVIELALEAPGLQVYAVAPAAFSVAVPPAHKTVGLAVIVKLGKLFTSTVTVTILLVQVPTTPATE